MLLRLAPPEPNRQHRLPLPAHPCSGISGGERRRLTCGEVLVGDREFIAMDEVRTLARVCTQLRSKLVVVCEGRCGWRPQVIAMDEVRPGCHMLVWCARELACRPELPAHSPLVTLLQPPCLAAGWRYTRLN